MAETLALPAVPMPAAMVRVWILVTLAPTPTVTRQKELVVTAIPCVLFSILMVKAATRMSLVQAHIAWMASAAIPLVVRSANRVSMSTRLLVMVSVRESWRASIPMRSVPMKGSLHVNRTERAMGVGSVSCIPT